MATTTKSDVFIPELLEDTVRGVFAQKNAFFGSALAQLGVINVSGTFTGAADEIGNEVTMPYFGSLGEFVDNNDGDSAVPVALKMGNEKATVARSSLGFEVTHWAQKGAVDDPYAEAARQILEAAIRKMDEKSMVAAASAGSLVHNIYSATTPDLLDYDAVVDGKFLWGDESSDAVAIGVHSKTYADLLKLKDADGNTIMQQQSEGSFARFCGLGVVQSDRLPLTGSTMGTVASDGTSPPVLTITGTPTGPWRLVIECQVGGAHETATYRFSVDGGTTWSADITTLGVGAAQPLTDTAIDSLVGNNGKTGLSVAFAAGTFNADNSWASVATLKATSLVMRPNALSFWYNRMALGLETDKDVAKHSNVGFMHLYYAAHRYRRVRQGTKTGIVQIQHNVSPLKPITLPLA